MHIINLGMSKVTLFASQLLIDSMAKRAVRCAMVSSSPLSSSLFPNPILISCSSSICMVLRSTPSPARRSRATRQPCACWTLRRTPRRETNGCSRSPESSTLPSPLSFSLEPSMWGPMIRPLALLVPDSISDGFTSVTEVCLFFPPFLGHGHLQAKIRRWFRCFGGDDRGSFRSDHCVLHPSIMDLILDAMRCWKGLRDDVAVSHHLDQLKLIPAYELNFRFDWMLNLKGWNLTL